jgi:MFS family permease
MPGRMWLIPESANANARRILLAKALRSLADGCVSILLPVYLLRLGLGAWEVGTLATATLLGSTVLTVLTGLITARFGHRRPLMAAATLMVLTGLTFPLFTTFPPLLLIAFLGTLNPSSGDVSIFLPLEQSLLGGSVADRDRTALFARYSVVASALGGLGTLLAALPQYAAAWLGTTALWAMRDAFFLYALIGLVAGAIYRGIRDEKRDAVATTHRPLDTSRGIVYRLAVLFSLDAFGGGFFVQSILALWLIKTFGLSTAAVGALFFGCSLLTAASYLAAPLIARRIGLINTMVFTHLPSNVCLIAMAFAPNLPTVVILLLLRSLLSQMDVPTRSSYVMAVVTAPERSAAAGLTTVPRSLAAAFSPTISGYLLSASSLAWPLLIGGALKMVYDVTLLAMFRHLRPPEEVGRSPVGTGRTLGAAGPGKRK